MTHPAIVLLLLCLAVAPSAWSLRSCTKKEGKKMKKLFEKYNAADLIDNKKCPQFDYEHLRVQLPENKWKKGCLKANIEAEATAFCEEEIGYNDDIFPRLTCCKEAYRVAIERGQDTSCNENTLALSSVDWDLRSEQCRDSRVSSAVQEAYDKAVYRCCWPNIKCKNVKKATRKLLKKVIQKLDGGCEYKDKDTKIEIVDSPDGVACPSDHAFIRSKCEAIPALDRIAGSRQALSCCIRAWKARRKLCKSVGWGTAECAGDDDIPDGCTSNWSFTAARNGASTSIVKCYHEELKNSLLDSKCSSKIDVATRKGVESTTSITGRFCYANAYLKAVEECNESCDKCESVSFDNDLCDGFSTANDARDGINQAREECCE